MIVRNISGAFIAALITVWLFLLMRYLILPGDKFPTIAVPNPLIELTREVRKEHSDQRKTTKLPRPVLQKAPPDRRAIPMVRITPLYPRGPLENGTEGWVLVEFTITMVGTVDDLVVIDAEPQNVFNRSAMTAMKRWKYQPKMENGKPVPQYNMQELITYVIEE